MSWELLDVLLVVGMVPFATANPILYGFFFPWRQSREGRAVLNLMVGLAALVDFSVLYKFVPEFPGKEVVAAIVYAAILVAMARMTYALVRLLHVCRRRKPRD